MTKGPISREDLTILDVHVPNNRDGKQVNKTWQYYKAKYANS